MANVQCDFEMLNLKCDRQGLQPHIGHRKRNMRGTSEKPMVQNESPRADPATNEERIQMRQEEGRALRVIWRDRIHSITSTSKREYGAGEAGIV